MGCAAKILIVDDTPGEIKVLGEILAPDYELLFATNGPDALACAVAASPDLIILDVVMPRMDGYEVCRRLKAEPRTAGIPVVFVTVRTEGESETAGLEVGADDYIHKPYVPAVIQARVRNLLARRAAELELAAKNAQLERSNADLQGFAHAASHDLQEPLRGIIGFLQLLQRRHGAGLDAEANEFISLAITGAHRMHGMILAMLAFSRAGNAGMHVTPVDPGEAARAALGDLHEAIAESGARITIADMPPVRADRELLMAVYQNLIGNAIKYRTAGAAPVVEVGAAVSQGGPAFFVRDDGIGIAPEYHRQIFDVFKRLHTQAHYPGSGVGLALCKRIIERHGGRIWVESRPGAGSTFWFSLSDV
jgi:signal transduction histidine kinase